MSTLGSMYSQITYCDHIQNIIQTKCISCHNPTSIAPMSFSNYEDVASYAEMISFVINKQLMPPSKIVMSDYLIQNHLFVTETEKELIKKWIHQGLNEGECDTEISAALNEKKYPLDTVICMEQPFEHYGIYYDQFQSFNVAINNQETLNVSGIYLEPGNKKTVRSITVDIADEEHFSKLDEWDPRYGFYQYDIVENLPRFPSWTFWSVKDNYRYLNSGEAKIIPPKSDLVFNIHYGPYFEKTTDSTCIHLALQQNTPFEKEIISTPLVLPSLLKDTFLIHANTKQEFTQHIFIPEDMVIRSIYPKMHYLGRHFEVFFITPSKDTNSIFRIKDWDYHWKERIDLNTDLIIPSGSVLICKATYDNTIDNPYNPSVPPSNMSAGPFMYDENFTCHFEIVYPVSKTASLKKPFTYSNDNFNTVDFNIEIEGRYTCKLWDLTSHETLDIFLDKTFTKGIHSIQKSSLDLPTGAYCLVLYKDMEVADSWWFVIHFPPN